MLQYLEKSAFFGSFHHSCEPLLVNPGKAGIAERWGQNGVYVLCDYRAKSGPDRGTFSEHVTVELLWEQRPLAWALRPPYANNSCR
jgi:hypothetical protein